MSNNSYLDESDRSLLRNMPSPNYRVNANTSLPVPKRLRHKESEDFSFDSIVPMDPRYPRFPASYRWNRSAQGTPLYDGPINRHELLGMVPWPEQGNPQRGNTFNGLNFDNTFPRADPRNAMSLPGAFDNTLNSTLRQYNLGRFTLSGLSSSVDGSVPPSVSDSGIPAAIINDVYNIIERQKDLMKKDLIERFIPTVAESLVEQSKVDRVPEIVIAKVEANLEQMLRQRLSTGIHAVLVETMVNKYGPQIVTAMDDLQQGKLICSKPCICGQNFPEDCIETCPCMKNKKMAKKQFPADCNDMCPCVQMMKQQQQQQRQQER